MKHTCKPFFSEKTNPMIKHILTTATAIALSIALNAQNAEFENYSWSKTPIISNSDTLKTNDGAAILLEKRIQEVYDNNKGMFEEIYVFHRIIKVETANAVSAYNQIYVPLDKVIDIINIKARFISKSGKITELPKESIKQVENLENKGNYKIFAIEGGEVGGEIEYFYVVRRSLKEYNGLNIQSEIPRYNVEVLFVFPEKLDYEVRSYNGFPKFEYQKDKNDKHYLGAKIAYIPSIEPEKYANYEASVMQYEYTLSYNRYTGASRVLSWNKSAKYFQNSIFTLTSKEEKAVANYLKTINLDKLDLKGKIRAIEAQVKDDIAVSLDIDRGQPLENLLKIKNAAPIDITKLLVALYKQAGIEMQLVLTSDRTERPFDPTFSCMNFLNDYLIYFPQLDTFIAPDRPNFRLGVMPEELTSTYGIFYQPVEYNKSLQGMGFDIRQIPEASVANNADTMLIKVKLNQNNSGLLVKTNRSFSGTLAQNYQAFWSYIADDRRQEIIKETFNLGTENSHLIDFKVTNSNLADVGLNPLYFEVNQEAQSLVERAENDILVKIGAVIGAQSEVYQEKERKLPIAVSTIMHYYREIAFTIPEGYKISNLADLNMNVEMIYDDKPSCGFSASYKLDGNTLYIYSREYYTRENYPATEFGPFRNVINAAADFNKKTLILTKK